MTELLSCAFKKSFLSHLICHMIDIHYILYYYNYIFIYVNNPLC